MGSVDNFLNFKCVYQYSMKIWIKNYFSLVRTFIYFSYLNEFECDKHVVIGYTTWLVMLTKIYLGEKLL